MKRKLKQKDVTCPREMMKAVSESSKRNQFVCSVNLHWFKWKEFLSLSFSTPTLFRIQQYHIFSFDKSSPGVLKAKRLTTSATWETFNFLKSRITALDLLNSTTQCMHNEEILKPNVVL